MTSRIHSKNQNFRKPRSGYGKPRSGLRKTRCTKKIDLLKHDPINIRTVIKHSWSCLTMSSKFNENDKHKARNSNQNLRSGTCSKKLKLSYVCGSPTQIEPKHGSQNWISKARINQRERYNWSFYLCGKLVVYNNRRNGAGGIAESGDGEEERGE